MPLDGLQDIIINLASFDVEEETKKILYENKDVLIGLLQLQLSLGKDGDNNPVFADKGPYYTDFTVKIKEQFGSGVLGKEVDHVTNYMSGNFYNNMYIVFSGDVFEIRSDVAYIDKILARGGRMMELSPVSLEIFTNDYLVPQLEARYEQVMNAAIR